MAYFPFMMDISNKKCLIIGGGILAAKKVITMLAFDPEIIVIAPKLVSELHELKFMHKNIQLYERKPKKADLKDVAMVIMATEDAVLNKRYANYCKEKNIPVNVVDVKEDCSFFFPALIKQQDVVIAISTGGTSPLLAGKIKREIKNHLRADYGMIATKLGKMREEVFKQGANFEERKQIFEEIIEEELKGRVESF